MTSPRVPRPRDAAHRRLPLSTDLDAETELCSLQPVLLFLIGAGIGLFWDKMKQEAKKAAEEANKSPKQKEQERKEREKAKADKEKADKEKADKEKKEKEKKDKEAKDKAEKEKKEKEAKEKKEKAEKDKAQKK